MKTGFFSGGERRWQWAKIRVGQEVPEGIEEQSKPRPWFLLTPMTDLTIAQILE